MATGPLDYTSGNGFFQGLQGANLYQQAQQQKMATEQMAQQTQAQQQNSALGNAAIDLQIAATQGPDALQAMLQKHSQVISPLGITPETALQTFTQDPQQFMQQAEMVGLKSLGPQVYFSAQRSAQQNAMKLQQEGQIAQQNLGYKYDALKQQSHYQNAQLNQGWQKLGLDAERNRIDLEDKRMNRQLQAGKIDADLQQRQAASIQKKQELVNAFDTQANNISGMLETVAQVKSIDPETFNNMFGLTGNINNAVPWASAAKDGLALLEQMQSQARLMGVIGMKGTGPVSDSEGQAAARAFLAVKPGISAKAAQTAIDNWQKVLDRQVQYLNKQRPTIDRYRSEAQPQQQSPGSYTSKSGINFTVE